MTKNTGIVIGVLALIIVIVGIYVSKDSIDRTPVARNPTMMEQGSTSENTEKAIEDVTDLGRGVFSAKIEPDEMMVDTPTKIAISGEIGSVKDVKSVLLYNLSDTSVSPITMYDTGENGDIRAHDTVFTAQEEIAIETESEIMYEIRVMYQDGYEAHSTDNLILKAYEPLAEGVSMRTSAFGKETYDRYLEYRSSMSINKARTKIFEEVKASPGVEWVVMDRHNLSVVFEGINLWISLYGPMDGPPID